MSRTPRFVLPCLSRLLCNYAPQRPQALVLLLSSLRATPVPLAKLWAMRRRRRRRGKRRSLTLGHPVRHSSLPILRPPTRSCLGKCVDRCGQVWNLLGPPTSGCDHCFFFYEWEGRAHSLP
jgi:hypothetical protein